MDMEEEELDSVFDEALSSLGKTEDEASIGPTHPIRRRVRGSRGACLFMVCLFGSIIGKGDLSPPFWNADWKRILFYLLKNQSKSQIITKKSCKIKWKRLQVHE